MELSKRLKAVADLVSAGSVVCDAGCDHGYVPIYLVKSGICRRAIAADVREGPLSCARENIKAFGLEQYIETRLSDGVSALKAGEADALILAGMGGRLVIKILTRGRTVVRSMKELILQPQSDIALVRVFLREEGYRVVQEDMVYEDGKYYPMMKVTVVSQCAGDEEADNGTRSRSVADTAEVGEGAERTRSLDEADEEDALRLQAFDRYGRYLLECRHPVLKQFLLWEQERENAIFRKLTDAAETEAGGGRLTDAAKNGQESLTDAPCMRKAPDRNARRIAELLAAERVREYA
ncbi:MAG: SAM-dependent methyltransferase, partial [Lachnospiraceae bacterium]|nr:SAM-dependent methyltransferase [Lachnospiraceae bacterium]